MTQAIRRQIESDIAWYDAKAAGMDSRKDVLALAVCIGATKALREVLDKISPSCTPRGVGECRDADVGAGL